MGDRSLRVMEQLGFDIPETVCPVCRRGEGHAFNCGLRGKRLARLEAERARAAELAALGGTAGGRPPVSSAGAGGSVPPAPALAPRPLRSEGEELALAGMARATQAEGRDWIERADNAIRALAASGAEFNSEDVRRLAGDPEHPNAMGGRFSVAARRGLILCVGRRKAERPTLHAHELRVWVGTGRRPR